MKILKISVNVILIELVIHVGHRRTPRHLLSDKTDVAKTNLNYTSELNKIPRPLLKS